ncbi:unnamed protein product [Somion occarium]|uniref:Uncharacterized protein n=1 Tax=Somion occarium TaxID=3059160 RepID=A0ABP1DRX1_9APHY
MKCSHCGDLVLLSPNQITSSILRRHIYIRQLNGTSQPETIRVTPDETSFVRLWSSPVPLPGYTACSSANASVAAATPAQTDRTPPSLSHCSLVENDGIAGGIAPLKLFLSLPVNITVEPLMK